jgi:hypothetical protein
MPQARVGQRVRVDMPELRTPGAVVGEGVTVAGIITSVNDRTREVTIRMDPVFAISVTGVITATDDEGNAITVRLDEPVDGQLVVTVPPERVAVLLPGRM